MRDDVRLRLTAAVLCGLVCANSHGQTMLDLRSQARNVDFSGAASARPFPVGVVLPPTCSTGQTFFRSDAVPGQNLYVCAAANTWVAIEGGKPVSGVTGGVVVNSIAGGSYTVDVNPTVVATSGGNNTYTGRNDFSGATALQVVVSTSRPADAACDTAQEVGQIVLRRSDPAQHANVLYSCQATGPSTFGWTASSYSYGSVKPATCDTGELFFHTSAPAGNQWLGCVARDTWSPIGGGGATLPIQSANGGKILGTNGSSAGWRTVPGFLDDGSRLVPDGTKLAELHGNNTWTGHQRYPASATQALTSATSAISCNRRTVAISSASPLTLTSTPTIPSGSDGQVCVLVNVGSADITIQDQDVVAGTNLQLAGTGVSVPSKGQITLQFSDTIGAWVQEGVQTAGSGPAATSNGFVVQTGSGVTARSIAGANGMLVSNSDGVSGDPVVSMPGSSKGEILIHNGEQVVPQASGPDGYVLESDSTEPTGVKWARKLPTTTKGDLIVSDGVTNVRQPAGTKKGMILSSDLNAATGLTYLPGTYTVASGTIATSSNSSSASPAADMVTIVIPRELINTPGDSVECQATWMKANGSTGGSSLMALGYSINGVNSTFNMAGSGSTTSWTYRIMIFAISPSAQVSTAHTLQSNAGSLNPPPALYPAVNTYTADVAVTLRAYLGGTPGDASFSGVYRCTATRGAL